MPPVDGLYPASPLPGQERKRCWELLVHFRRRNLRTTYGLHFFREAEQRTAYYVIRTIAQHIISSALDDTLATFPTDREVEGSPTLTEAEVYRTR